MEELSDEQLVERSRSEQGTPAAREMLDVLFRRHRTRVAAWCYRMTGDVDSAADLAQDIFLKAFQRLDSFRAASRFTTWLYSIARNHCLDELRSRSCQPGELTDAALEEIVDSHTEDVSSAFDRFQSHELVRRFMRESLDETEVKVMIMHYVNEIPLETITRLMGLGNPSGSKAYIVSARRKLGRALEQWRRTHGSAGGSRGR